MGVRSLDSFVNEVVPGGVVEVSIAEECRKYSENNEGRKPTLVIDIMGLTTVLNHDKVDIYYGRSHRACFKAVDKLFKALSGIADLVFFQDGPKFDKKIWTSAERGNDRYKMVLAMIDKVKQNVPIAEIVENWEFRSLPRTSSGFEFTSKLAAKYGRHRVSVIRECDVEIAKFAYDNPSVIAVIAEDSDFLIFPGNWRYFSCKHFDVDKLATKEYDRLALRSFLGLDDLQLAVLATIAGNDIIRHEEVRHCHGEEIGIFLHYKEDGFVRSKFLAIAQKIKTFDGWGEDDIITFLASFLLHDESHEAKWRIAESIDQYNIALIPSNERTPKKLLEFCIKSNFSFTYTLLQRKAWTLLNGFHDRRNSNWPNFHAVHESLKQRQMGVVLEHQRPGLGKLMVDLYSKKSHTKPMKKCWTSPVYPDFEVPTLIELLDREEFPEHDKVRFDLLKWTISDTLKDIDVSSIPQTYLQHVLTLHFMVAEGFITKFDADIILLTIKDAAEDKIPDEYDYPPIVDPSAFQIVFLFLEFFIEVELSFEAAGLMDLSTPQTFEGKYFHGKYLDFLKSKEDPSASLQDIDNLRIYKNLPDKGSAVSF